MNIQKTLFGFDGRIRRATWWLWSIVSGVVYAVVLVLAATVVMGGGWGGMFDPVIGDPPWLLALALALHAPLLWVQLALGAKRAHDRNASARLVIVLQVIAAICTYAPRTPLDGGQDSTSIVAGAMALMYVAVNLYLFVVLGCLDGTQGPNRFGRSPKGIGGDPADSTAEIFR